MIEGIKKFFNRIGGMIAFGMKGANDEMLSQNTNNADIGVIQNVENKNIGQALINGEVTQQVEELRYSNYKILKEADKYSYIGGGNAIKRKKDFDRQKFSFFQQNNVVCESVNHELNRVGKTDIERYTFEILYKDVMKYKLEAYANYGKFSIDNEKIVTELFFDKTIMSKYDPVSYAIIKEIEKISKFTSSHQIENNDICSNPTMLTFVTYKCNGDDDMVKYTIRNLQFDGCTDNGNGFILKYVSNNFSRIDLTEQFYSKTMDEKYLRKEQKSDTVNLFNEKERLEYCDICGKPMNKYDADITRYEFGKAICVDCLKKHKIKQEILEK